MLVAPKRKRQALAQSQSYPAPIGGWNALDSLAAMKPDEAVYLDNWFPNTTSVDLRAGSTNWATGITGRVETLASYNTPAGTQKLFGAVSGTGFPIYNVTASGAVPAAETLSITPTSARWQYVNITTAGGSYLYMVNGVDKPQLYDGATWTSIDGASTPAITGVTTTTLVNIWMHKNRVWFVQNGTSKAWYLPVDAVGGAAASFDLSAVFQQGGFLMAGATWTIDAGAGVDDYQVFVSSEGEVLVYQGTDPASGTTWALKGRYYVGTPIGRRCFANYAGDLLLISQDGVLPMSRALQSSRVNPKVAVTNKIQYAMSQAATSYSANFGWELLLYPVENMLLLNVPTSSTTSVQYAMNTITGAWCSFSGWNAACWCLHNDEIYFGTTNKVVKAWSGYDDMGLNIVADAKSAFNYFGTRSQKLFTMARPIIVANALPPLAVGLNYDFDDTDPTGAISGAVSTAGVWDTALWDVGVWGGDPTIIKYWQGVRGIGFAAATRLKFEGKNYSVSWISTDYVYQSGGIL